VYVQPPAPRLPEGPSRGWYWVACALVVVGLGSLILLTLLYRGDLKDVDDYPSAADGTVQHTLTKGTEYLVYQEKPQTPPTSSVSCDITVAGHPYHEVLKTKLPFSAPDSDDNEGKLYRYVGRFSAPTDGPAAISCPALADHWMLTRDATGVVVWFTGCCLGCFVLPLALLLIVLVAWRRKRAHEKFERDPWGRR
jgi:hypothetical protein